MDALFAGRLLIPSIVMVAAAGPLKGEKALWFADVSALGYTMAVCRPHFDSWTGSQVRGYAEVSVAPWNSDQRWFGQIRFEALGSVDESTRTVSLSGFELNKGRIPLAGEAEERIITAMASALHNINTKVSLDRLQSDIESRQVRLITAPAVAVAAPQLIVAKAPAIQLAVDGEPMFRKIPGTQFSRLSNTTAAIFRDESSGRLYLELEQFWMSARSLDGHWSPEPNPPVAISAVDGRGDRDNVGEVDREEAAIASTTAPQVVVSFRPSRVVEVASDPKFGPVGETGLQYVTNTAGDLFQFVPTGAFYAFADGNWYHAPSLWGAWSRIPGANLPVDFARIPPDHPKEHLLASIPGTVQAEDAVYGRRYALECRP